jgi:hypothetical protein
VIIFGIRDRIASLGAGWFFCPRCHGDRHFTRKGVRRWFTLFFVPIAPLGGTTTTHIWCDTCGTAFSEEVLQLPTAEEFRSVYRRTLRQCVLGVLKAGAPASSLARASALAAINDADAQSKDFDDAALDAALVDADADQLAVAANPVASRLDPRQAERFFGACAQVALADGPLSDGERRALGTLGESLHLTEVHQLGASSRCAPPLSPRSTLGPTTRETVMRQASVR